VTIVVDDGWYDENDVDIQPDEELSWYEFDRLRDEWLWAQADAYYDYMQEDGIE